MKRIALALAVCALVMSVPAGANAYVYSGQKWPTTSVKYILSGSLSSNERSIVRDCATTWNNGPSNWTLTSTTDNGVYNIWSKTSFSANGWSDVPGQTEITPGSGSPITKCRSWFNTDYSWNNSGTMNRAQRKCDYKTVIIHEFGHWIRLCHDERHTSAVMWPNWTTKQQLTTDDKNGLDYVY